MNRVLTKSFLEINKTKIVKLFFTTSLLFSLFILFIGFIDKEPLNYKIIFVFVLVFSLGFPTLILLIAYLDWFLKKRFRTQVLNTKAFKELHKLGFHLTLINEDSFWYFTEEILEANFKTYRLQFNIVRGFPNIIEFKAFVKRMEIDNKKFSYLLADFEKENIFFDFDAIKKVYKLKKVNDMTSAQLENELDFFIKKLKENGFEAN